MFRTTLGSAVVLVLLHVMCGPTAAQPNLDPKAPNYRSLSEVLETSVDTADFHRKIKFKAALELLKNRTGGKLPIIVDHEGILMGADATEPFEEEVILSQLPAKMKASQILRLLLTQIGRGGSAYVIRNGVIEITTVYRIHPSALLAYPITARFDKTPLEDAIEALCEMSGATIVIDGRLGEKAKTSVSANFRGSIALEGAVRLLAEMADLQAEVRENVLFVTSPVKAGGQQQKTELHFKGRRLDLAVKDLAAWSGQAIELDPVYIPEATEPELPFGGRGQKKRLEGGRWLRGELKPSSMQWIDPDAPTAETVTASFKPNVSAKAAAEVIARQCGLSVVVLDNLIFITRPLARKQVPVEK